MKPAHQLSSILTNSPAVPVLTSSSAVSESDQLVGGTGIVKGVFEVRLEDGEDRLNQRDDSEPRYRGVIRLEPIATAGTPLYSVAISDRLEDPVAITPPRTRRWNVADRRQKRA